MRQKNKYKKVKVEDDYDDDMNASEESSTNIKKRKGEESPAKGVEMI